MSRWRPAWNEQTASRRRQHPVVVVVIIATATAAIGGAIKLFTASVGAVGPARNGERGRRPRAAAGAGVTPSTRRRDADRRPVANCHHETYLMLMTTRTTTTTTTTTTTMMMMAVVVVVVVVAAAAVGRDGSTAAILGRRAMCVADSTSSSTREPCGRDGTAG